MLGQKIDRIYKEFCEKRSEERKKLESTKSTIMYSVKVAAAATGAAISLFVAPPVGLSIVAGLVSAAGAASTGVGVGATIASGVNALIKIKNLADIFKKKK